MSERETEREREWEKKGKRGGRSNKIRLNALIRQDSSTA